MNHTADLSRQIIKRSWGDLFRYSINFWGGIDMADYKCLCNVCIWASHLRSLYVQQRAESIVTVISVWLTDPTTSAVMQTASQRYSSSLYLRALPGSMETDMLFRGHLRERQYHFLQWYEDSLLPLWVVLPVFLLCTNLLSVSLSPVSSIPLQGFL